MLAKFLSLPAVVVTLSIAAIPLVAQRSAAPFNARIWSVPRTSDNQPDLQGIWTNATLTPLERPLQVGQKSFFTAVEAEAYEKEARERNNGDRRDANPEADLTTGYNDFWWDRGTKVVS